MTGPLSNKNTSASGVGEILHYLKGNAPRPAYSAENNFGSSVHERFLENKAEYKITKEEELLVAECLAKLKAHAVVKHLMKDAVSEQKLYRKIYGVLVAYILDIHKKKERIGADLKTTVCKTLQEFIGKAFEYGYFRQAATYIKAANLKLFFFIGITKHLGDVKVLIFCANDYKDHLEYAHEELRFLLYFFKHYGKALPHERYQNNAGDQSPKQKVSAVKKKPAK